MSDYDPILNELEKLDALSTGASQKRTKSKGKTPSASLDVLLASLKDAKAQLVASQPVAEVAQAVKKAVETSKKEIDDRQKEIYNSLNRMGKALDKKFPEPLPNYPSLFCSPESSAALNRVVALHLLRTGAFPIAETFIREASVDLSPNHIVQFEELYRIVNALRGQDLSPALSWCEEHRDFLIERHSSLAFNLHSYRYIRIIHSCPPSDPSSALSYARRHFPPLYASHPTEIAKLTNALVYLSRLSTSPYADLVSPSAHNDLEAQFSHEYCALLHLSKQLPLQVVGDLGGGGALSLIERGKRVLNEKKTEWAASDELPVEIRVPSENQYHSIFACPVSKEQSTEANPPVMLTCGHVLAKDSATKLAKAGNRIKCPYCPVESTKSPQRVWF